MPTWQAAGGGGGGLTFVNITGTSQSASVNSSYLVSNASATTITLPGTCALGDQVRVQGQGAAGWTLTANSGQVINMGSSPTSTAGSVASVNRYDCIQVMCSVANTTWVNMGSVSGGLTIT